MQNTKSDSQTAPYGNDNIRSVLKADLPYVLEGNIYTFLTEDSEGQVTALERLKLLYAVGILTEDILNNTTVYGISCIDENEKEHDGTRGFRHMKEPLIITLNLLLKTDRLLVSDSNIVYAVENSGVFSELVSIINESEKGGLSLICTNGQLTTASLMVFDMLKEQDVKVFYAGDFDPEGIKIADNLIRRYPMVEPWCMSPADYLDSDPQVELSPRRLSVLKNINNEILRNTADRLQKVGRTGYQERLIGKYLKSMNMY